MKKLIGFLFAVIIIALIVFLVYGFVNGNINFPSGGNGKTPSEPTYNYYETPENVEVDYSTARISVLSQSYTNLEWGSSTEGINYVDSKVNLYVSFKVEGVENATSIFSFNHDFETYDPANSEESTIDLNKTNRTVRLKNGSDSVTITVPNVELNELGKVVYELGNKNVYVFQYFIADNTVIEKMHFNLSDFDVKWEIEVEQRENVNVGGAVTEYDAGEFLNVLIETQDYSEYDHTGFDGKTYIHTGVMAFKSDYVSLIVNYSLNENWKYKDESDAIPTLYLNDTALTTEDITETSDLGRKAIFKFKYADVNSEDIKITKMAFKNESGHTSNVKVNYNLISRDTFVFYDGTYSGVDSLLTVEEQNMFMTKYSVTEDATKMWDGTDLGQNLIGDERSFGLDAYIRESDEKYDYKVNQQGNPAYNTHYSNLDEVYSANAGYSMPWVHVNTYRNCENAVATYDPYIIKGNWLVVNHIKVEHLGGIEGSINRVVSDSDNLQIKHGKAQINIFNHDVILDGYFNFDGYSIQYGDLESDYGTWYYYTDEQGKRQEEYVLYQTFDFACDTYLMSDFRNHLSITGYNPSWFTCDTNDRYSYRDLIDVKYNYSAFSLFQRITENGKFANCFIDYSGIPNNMGQYYNMLGIDVNEGVIDNIKTSGQNFVWENFGSITNVEQECIYMLNSIYNLDQCDILSFNPSGKDVEMGLLVANNHENAIVKDVKTTVTVLDSEIIAVSGLTYSGLATEQFGSIDVTLEGYNCSYKGMNITAKEFNNSKEADKIYNAKSANYTASKYEFVSNMRTKTAWKYRNISCVSKFNNYGVVENATINYKYNGSQNLNGYFEAYSYEKIENTAEEALKAIRPLDSLLTDRYYNYCS